MSQPTPAPAAPSFAVADAELPAVTRGTETAGPNPLKDVLRQSKETGKGKAVTVPAAQVASVVRYIRRAANDLNIGARIVLTSGDGRTKLDTEMVGGTKTAKGRTSGGRLAVIKPDGAEYKGQVRVLFQGQNRKARTPKPAETAPAETAEAQSA